MDAKTLPSHVALIPDGSRRWATSRGESIRHGHEITFLETVPWIISMLQDEGIHTITVWAFSTENWKRPHAEIQNLMLIYADFARMMQDASFLNGIQIRHIGRVDRIPDFLSTALRTAELKTAGGEHGIVNIALDYGGREDILQAIERLYADRQMTGLPTHSIDEYLYTGGQPYPCPDIVIRTSGEKRLSGFMSWQTTYSELYFIDAYVPELRPFHIREALEWYSDPSH